MITFCGAEYETESWIISSYEGDSAHVIDGVLELTSNTAVLSGVLCS